MKKRLLQISALLAFLLPLFLQNTTPVNAQETKPVVSEPYGGTPLCLPGAFLEDPQDCIPAGPSQYLTELARQGLSYPPRPLPAASPDPQLNEVSTHFAKINAESSEQVAVYSSVQDANAGTNPIRYIPSGVTRYVSFQQQMDVDGKHFVQLNSGEWMRASPAALNFFQGLVFKNNPQTSFGWIVEPTHPRSGPGYDNPEITRELQRETVVQIYQVLEKDKTDWYMIGLNEWVERRYIRQVKLTTTPPEGVDNNRWVEVNLFEQTLVVYENGRMLFATLVATGAEPYYTQPGLFKIYQKKPSETMTGAFAADKSDYYLLEDVPWTMYFDKARALHGAYWRAMYGYPQSHGCVNLSIGDSRWLYDWAKEGDWVYVWDPSGETPTDPAFYNDGGA